MRNVLVPAVLGCLLAAPCGGAVRYAARFEQGLPGWTVKNMGGNVDIRVGRHHGKKALLVTGKPGVKGTAWELAGEPFAVTPGSRISVAVRTRGTVSRMRFAHGYMGQYISGVVWYDSQDRRVSVPLGFGYDLSPDEWRVSGVRGTVPAGAVKARLLIGCDTPNFRTNDVLAVSEAIVRTIDPVAPQNRVTLRDDGSVLVGGKPFFPIGIYAVAPCKANGDSLDHAFRDLKAAGVNLVHCSSPTAAEHGKFLSLADRHGLKVFSRPTPSFKSDFYFDSFIPELKHHASVLAWYLADDTASNTDPEIVARRDRCCKMLDDDHLTFQADAVMMGGAYTRYAEYVQTTDVFLPELYPVYEKTPHGREVAEIVINMQAIRAAIAEAGNPVKSVWPIIQHFDGWGAWKRFPTFDELRAMSWASIVHGGRGITWYVYHSRSGRGRGVADVPGRMEELAAVTREIADVTDDLVLRDAPDCPVVEVLSGPRLDAFGNPSVTTLLKSGDAPLLVAVNATTNAVTARIAAAGFRRAEALRGKRRLAVGRDGFTDSFAPYAVHLYRLGR